MVCSLLNFYPRPLGPRRRRRPSLACVVAQCMLGEMEKEKEEEECI